MSDPHEEGPECDFCNLAVDEDESLQPIYVGELPQPKPHRLTEVAKKGKENFHVLGKSVGEFQAMYMALEKCPDIDISISPVVDEVRAMDGTRHAVTEEQTVPVKGDVKIRTNRRDDKVGVELTVRPKDVTYESDAEVCDTCAEMFKSL